MPRMLTRRAAMAALAGSAMLAPAMQGAAQSARAIRFVVPFGPGGAGDLTARIVAQKMSETMGQPIVIDNKPGAGGVVAATAVAKAAPDGQTILLLTNGAAVTAALFKSLPYDTLKDFTPVTTLAYFDMVVMASAESRFKTLKDLLDFSRANPGKLNLGTISVGSSQNLTGQLFTSMAGIQATVVPFNGTPALVTALRGGDIDVAVEIVAPVITQIQSGAVRALAVMGDRANEALPGVPTAAEAGVPGFAVAGWNGLGAPAGTPSAIVERLNKEANAALADPAVRKRLADINLDPRGGSSEQMAQLMKSEIERWSQVIDKAGIPRQ